MVVNIFKMYFFRFIIFSILLYNIEARAYYDWEEPVSKDDYNTTMVVDETEGTTMKPEPNVFNNTDRTDKVDTTTSTERAVNSTFPSSWSRPWTYHRNTTPSEEYRPWYLRNTTPRVPSWLPMTRRPTSHHYPWYPPPSSWGTTTPSWPTTTVEPSWDSNGYYDNTTWSSSGNSIREIEYGATLNSNRNNTHQTTVEANPDGSCKSCNPVNISINSKINQSADGETGNYGTFVSFLKKVVGKIIPSAINIAPNSNATNNVAVASGNGNMFFYVYN